MPIPRTRRQGKLATIAEVGNLASVLKTADPSDRAQLYEALGVTATYDAGARKAVLEVALPRSAKQVSENELDPTSTLSFRVVLELA